MYGWRYCVPYVLVPLLLPAWRWAGPRAFYHQSTWPIWLPYLTTICSRLVPCMFTPYLLPPDAVQDLMGPDADVELPPAASSPGHTDPQPREQEEVAEQEEAVEQEEAEAASGAATPGGGAADKPDAGGAAMVTAIAALAETQW